MHGLEACKLTNGDEGSNTGVRENWSDGAKRDAAWVCRQNSRRRRLVVVLECGGQRSGLCWDPLCKHDPTSTKKNTPPTHRQTHTDRVTTLGCKQTESTATETNRQPNNPTQNPPAPQRQTNQPNKPHESQTSWKTSRLKASSLSRTTTASASS